jgi:hypothetical protein
LRAAAAADTADSAAKNCWCVESARRRARQGVRSRRRTSGRPRPPTRRAYAPWPRAFLLPMKFADSMAEYYDNMIVLISDDENENAPRGARRAREEPAAAAADFHEHDCSDPRFCSLCQIRSLPHILLPLIPPYPPPSRTSPLSGTAPTLRSCTTPELASKRARLGWAAAAAQLKLQHAV